MSGNVLAYTIRRLIAGVPVVLIVLLLTFTLIYMTPGDAATVIAGDDATPEQVREIRESLGLDRPLWVQFGAWMVALFSGDLGESLVLPQSVGEALIARAEPTIMLALLAQVIAILIAVPFGVLAAKYYGGGLDRTVNFLAVAGIAVPPFVIGIALILIFSVSLPWFPASGYVPISDGFLDAVRSLILPALALGLVQAAFIVRITRSSMYDVFSSDFVRAVTMRGLSSHRITVNHVLRAGAGPTISAIGVSFGSLISGAIVVEIVFNLPGLGRLLLSAIQTRDIPTLQGLLLVVTLTYIVVNIATDIIQAAFNPRVAL